jgi:hypothetical protein
MPITILDYVKSVVGQKDSYSAEDFHSNGVDMLGGCERCHATIAAYNACPSKSGYWRCTDCVGDDGFTSVEEFLNFEKQSHRAVSWLLRLRQLQADGMDFEAALALANAEADQNDREAADDPDAIGVDCPACGAVKHITEIWENVFKCGDCESTWRL